MTHLNLRKAGNMMWTVLGFLLAISLVLLGILVAWSPGRPQPFLDETGQPLMGSLSQKIRVEINGMEQGLFIKSRNIHNPVLLFVHGGPGMPEYWLTQRHPTGLEDHFTVVWWEQRGAGLSYSPNLPPESRYPEKHWKSWWKMC
jgi:pimeloyl-ACP methyl ester carboxylesterase